MQAPHVNISIFARGVLNRLATRLYFEGDPANAEDPVLKLIPAERRATLATVEMFTSGQIAARFAPQIGADAVFRRGFVAHRLAEVADIVPSYVFLASDEARHFQGQCLSPNGGDVFL